MTPLLLAPQVGSRDKQNILVRGSLEAGLVDWKGRWLGSLYADEPRGVFLVLDGAAIALYAAPDEMCVWEGSPIAYSVPPSRRPSILPSARMQRLKKPSQPVSQSSGSLGRSWWRSGGVGVRNRRCRPAITLVLSGMISFFDRTEL